MYDVGDVVPLGLQVTDSDGNPADSTTVVLTIGLPDGTEDTPTVDHDTPDSGQYTVDYVATQEGLHTVSWVATGVNATSYTDVFNVRSITDQVISLTEAKRQLRLTTTTDYDDDLRLFIAAATVAVEDHTHEKMVRRTITGERHFRACGHLILNRTPALSLTTVETVDGASTWDVSSLDLDPDTGIVHALSGPGLYGDLKVTYVCGKRVIPANRLLAVRIITEHLWQTMRPFSGANLPVVAGALEDSLDSRAGGLVGFAIPNRALELLGKPGPLVA